jgi:membrane-bound lytic murein transglycosylase D
MKPSGWCVMIYLIAPVTAPAQEFGFELDPAVVQSVREWVQDNLDENALAKLGVDQERVVQFLREAEKGLQGSSVYDLASFRDAAPLLLPLLNKFEETRPYGAWLETHLDYFEVSETLRRELPKETPPQQAPVLAPQRGRTAWVSVVEKRPVPPAAEKYLPRLKAIFIEEKVPVELVWVAEAESSFNPGAKSPVGAVGLFQLMPQTAKGLDLSLFPRDERYQPEKNARAAAKYLRQLYERFGDWRLALAAYNAGPTRVEELLKKRKARTYDEIATRLPAETQMYVPKVEAIVQKREGKPLGSLKFRAG